ncbi:MAG: DUF748 domain-containing protein [Candidatus Brocadiales bacterium]
MKRFTKIIIILFIVLVSLIIGLFLFKNPLIKSVVTAGASQVTGVPVHIDDFSFSIFKQAIQIRGLKLYNPEGFPEEVFLDIPEVRVDYDLFALLKGKIHLPLIVFNLKEMVVVRNKEGKLNVDSIRAALKQEKPSEEEEVEVEEVEEPAEEPSEPMEMYIDVMTLSIGKVTYKDYTKGDQPYVKSFDAGIKEKTYRDITSAQQFGTLVLKEAIGQKVIKEAIVKEVASALGVESLTGKAADIAGIAEKFLGKDSSSADFNVDYNIAYKVTLETIQQIGKVTKDDKNSGWIKAKVDGSSVKVEITKKAAEKVQIKVSARKFVIPQPKLTEEILSKITEELK